MASSVVGCEQPGEVLTRRFVAGGVGGWQCHLRSRFTNRLGSKSPTHLTRVNERPIKLDSNVTKHLFERIAIEVELF